MKRTLVAATAAAVLLSGCATGETGHLDPEIAPDLAAPLAEGGSGVGGDAERDDEPDQELEQAGAEPAELRLAFADAAETEPWYGEVVTIEVDGTLVLLSTGFVAGDADAVAACEAAFTAAQDSGIESPSVEVRDSAGQLVSQRDDAADDAACSTGTPEPTATETTSG